MNSIGLIRKGGAGTGLSEADRAGIGLIGVIGRGMGLSEVDRVGIGPIEVGMAGIGLIGGYLQLSILLKV